MLQVPLFKRGAGIGEPAELLACPAPPRPTPPQRAPVRCVPASEAARQGAGGRRAGAEPGAASAVGAAAHPVTLSM